MEFGQIIDLIKAVSDSNLTEFEIQDGETKISMETNKETKQITVTAPLVQPQLSAVQPAAVQEEEKAEEKTET